MTERGCFGVRWRKVCFGMVAGLSPRAGLRDRNLMVFRGGADDGDETAFFLWWMTRELQINARQGLEGRAQPVPAGVRSATKGMEPEGGTPESPHTGHEMFFYKTFVLPRKRRKKRKKKKTWLYFRDFTLSPSMNWKGTNL